ncbi:MAG: sensor histidine kinase [Luteolibacter sp.]
MKRKAPNFSKYYQEALTTQLQTGRLADPEVARSLHQPWLAAGIPILELAKLHEQTLLIFVLPYFPVTGHEGLVKQAGIFFATVIAADETVADDVRETTRLKKIIQTLDKRTSELTASNLRLTEELGRCERAEKSLTISGLQHSKCLEESNLLRVQLQGLSRRIIATQEHERRNMSRELHDGIAQTLIGINIRLINLKKMAGMNTKDLIKDITVTQRLVTNSTNRIHRFARDLRPAVLDDLGLIPALHSFMKNFTAHTGVRTHLTTIAGVEDLAAARRTALFRVAQEALTNVGRHAGATNVRIDIRKNASGVCVRIEDDGKSFDVKPFMTASGGKCHGLLGMRERLEMVGGSLLIESSPGKGTAVIIGIPEGRYARKKRPLKASAISPELS